MKRGVHLTTAVLVANSVSSVIAQTWCGKNFMSNQTVVPPGGQFQPPANSSEPLLAFRCSPAFRPYLEVDAQQASVIVDTTLVYRRIQGASPILLSNSRSQPSGSQSNDLGTLDVTIDIGDRVFVQQTVPLNTTGYEINLDIGSLVAQTTQYNVTCGATYQSESSSPQTFLANTTLLYLPDADSSVVKTDLRTGSLWVRPANESGGDFAPFVPRGIYVSFDQYLAKNLSLIDQLKADGFNTIHLIPPYDDATLFEQVIQRAGNLGLYIIYDLRSVYQNLTAVAEQVNTYSSIPNLLLWETAHEPDGNSDLLTAARSAYDLIYQLDGYHPVSIVLNCQDYNFSPYVEGADIVIEDAYPLGIDPTYSRVWHTDCTPDFGHCGCDNCWEANVNDIKDRIQIFKDRLDILGYDRRKTVWTTLQAFGSGAYWNTTPTGQQWVVMMLASLNHGATGIMSFQYPTTTGNRTTIEGTAPGANTVIADVIQPFLVNPDVTYKSLNPPGVDVGLWYNGTTYLLLVANLDGSPAYATWASVGLDTMTSNVTTQIQRVFSTLQRTDTTGLIFMPWGAGVYTVTPPA